MQENKLKTEYLNKGCKNRIMGGDIKIYMLYRELCLSFLSNKQKVQKKV